MNFKELDKEIAKIEKVLDAQGCCNHNSIVEGDIRYCDLRDIVQAYRAFRQGVEELQEIMACVRKLGATINWFDLDKAYQTWWDKTHKEKRKKG